MSQAWSKIRLFPALLAALFALQVLVALPQHTFHGSTSHSAAPHGDEGSKTPDDSRCDFTLAFAGLDSGSPAQPPALSLHETAFAVVAAYATFEYSRPVLFAQARGPPVLS